MIAALRQSRIEVVAIHSHMLEDQPRHSGCASHFVVRLA
ncbi:MAG: DUF1259 domain-containing protein [Methyloceanibacter sp.]